MFSQIKCYVNLDVESSTELLDEFAELFKQSEQLHLDYEGKQN